MFQPTHISSIIKPSILALSLVASFAANAAQEVNVYTTREPKLLQPLLAEFTKTSGIKVNTIFVKDGLLERVRTEGSKSPADILMTVDAGNLVDLVEAGVTQPVKSQALDQFVPANLRDAGGQWYALSLRARVLYAEKDLPISTITYEELADPKWKGKICIRSGQHPYNTALVASMIAHHGEADTKKWLQGVKSNLARKATGGDRDVARDIMGGICDIGLANSYYVGQLKNAEAGSDARKWGDAIKVVRPTFIDAKGAGTHVNISGASLAKHAPNKEEAVKFLEFLVSEKAQEIYAQVNFEYPVRSGVKLDPMIQGWGALTVDPLPIADMVKFRKRASTLVDEVSFDN